MLCFSSYFSTFLVLEIMSLVTHQFNEYILFSCNMENVMGNEINVYEYLEVVMSKAIPKMYCF